MEPVVLESPNEPTKFVYFMKLPPELRRKIYLAAIPSPGINFFNVHSFPNDHKGANRSDSPPNLHLDLRRIYKDDDDETVASYDASAWQIRHILRQTCAEARVICAIPEDKIIHMTLSMPKRGHFTEAGDGLQRSMTPFKHPVENPEATIYRQIEMHADDMVVLSIENNSFNIVFEESTMFHVGRDVEEDETDLGWAYDPQFENGRTLGLPPSRVCLELIRDEWANMRALEEVAAALFAAAIGNHDNNNNSAQTYGNIMFTSETVSQHELDEKYRRGLMKFWDNFGDCYAAVPWDYDDLPVATQIIKLSPEKESATRRSYITSAILKSPKRPINL